MNARRFLKLANDERITNKDLKPLFDDKVVRNLVLVSLISSDNVRSVEDIEVSKEALKYIKDNIDELTDNDQSKNDILSLIKKSDDIFKKDLEEIEKNKNNA